MNETLSQLFTRKREAQGLTLRQVAKAVGTGHVHLWEIEVGKHSNPTIKTLARLQDFYGISTRELWAAAKASIAARNAEAA
jgi:transcriptional regulator with XRE-family HTH domain